MPNIPTLFITKRTGAYGSSLYYVTNHWIMRCSGNTSEGRVAETFIRRRDIEYITADRSSNMPTVGSCPREGQHDGNPIRAILTHINAAEEPAEWVSANGVSWATAVAEVLAATRFARRTQWPRASRVVGSGVDFAKD